MKIIEFNKVIVSDMQSHKTVDKYSLLSRDNFVQPNQMDLSQKQKTFSKFFLHFPNLHQIWNIYKQKDDAHSLCISEITDSERCG